MNTTPQHIQQNSMPDKVEKPEFDIKAYLTRLLRYFWVIILSVILSFFIARIILRYSTPIYNAQGTIFLKVDPNSSSEGAVFQELSLFPSENRVANEIYIIKSRNIMKEVVRELGLDFTYIVKGRIREIELYKNSPVLVDTIRWGIQPKPFSITIQIVDDYIFKLKQGENESSHIFGYPFVYNLDTILLERRFEIPANNQEIIISYAPPEAVAPRYQRGLFVEEVEEFSSVLNLKLQDPVPQKAADILNMLVDIYNREAIKDKSEVQRKTLDFINERLALLTAELSAVESRVESYKETQQIPTEASATLEIALSEISQYDNELITLQIRLNLLRSIEDRLSRNVNTFDPIPANLLLEDVGGLAGQITRYNELVLNRERLLRSARPENPLVITANQELGEIRRVILNSIQSLRENLQANIEEIQRRVNQLQRRVGQIPRQERQLLEIKRQQNIKENLYLYLLQKKEEAALSSAVTVANARVIDPAVPGGIVSPNSARTYASFLLIGMVLPMGIIFLITFLDNKVYSEEDVRNLTLLPIAGSVARNRTKDYIVVRSDSRSGIAEMFRMLRTNLNYLAAGNTYQVIMITSGLGGDGKTFISMNLGMTLALSGKRTVIVGTDLRKPKLKGYLLGVADQKGIGLTNYLVNSAPVETIIQSTELSPNLFYIPSGPIPPNPAELIGSLRMKDLVEELRQQFDYIVIDTAPIGLVTDAFLLNDFVDLTLLVVRYGKTPKGIIQLLEKARVEQKLVNPAIILNGISPKKGYGYGYGYGYGNGYYDDSGRRNLWKTLRNKISKRRRRRGATSKVGSDNE